MLGLALVVVLLALSLRLRLAPDVKQDFVVHDVAHEACGPQADPDPEQGTAEGSVEKPLRGGGREVRAHKRAVDEVVRNREEWYRDVRLGARGRAQGRDERAVDVVHAVEPHEERRRVAERQCGRTADARRGQGRVQECVGEPYEGDKLHEYPGLDACKVHPSCEKSTTRAVTAISRTVHQEPAILLRRSKATKRRVH